MQNALVFYLGKCIKPFRSAGSRSTLTIDCETDPDFDSGGYIVYSTRNEMQEASQSQSSLPITISNLEEETAYDIVVEARNSEGTRENSTVVLIRTNRPGWFITDQIVPYCKGLICLRRSR